MEAARLTRRSALSFLKTSGASDMALEWQQLSDSRRASYLQEYNSAGISLIVSTFGSTEKPTTAGTDPIAVANNIAAWVMKYGAQGVDVEYEVLFRSQSKLWRN